MKAHLTFGEFQGNLQDEGTIIVQNQGNSMNEYSHITHARNYTTHIEGCRLRGSTKSTDFMRSIKAKLKGINDYVTEEGIENAQIIITATYE